MNYYTYSIIILRLENNDIYIESDYECKGCKMDFLSEDFSVNSKKHEYKNEVINKIININIKHKIEGSNIYGNIILNELNELNE
jgi:hypothetical protein